MLSTRRVLTSARPNSALLFAKPQATASLPPSASTRRFMASNPVSKKEWLVMIPDKAGVLETRVKVRNEHLQNIRPHVESKKVVMGGSWFPTHPDEGKSPAMEGSAMIITGETKQEILEFIRGDIYTTSGVWDAENASITPFRSAIREPL